MAGREVALGDRGGPGGRRWRSRSPAPSRTASENAVICSVVPISSAIESKPFQRTESVIGLERLVAHRLSSPSSVDDEMAARD